ncbi:MAG: bifunctional alpha,alpha-trehalose-phosphate synthase (UDP-forming)/trehalose-phosphatase [Chloroflexi bacterium]|nr:bifunctional alpha,alpha-trehalose-phosphate synthase (UDP-forming)/trehalose-phosphatase [Chloroflexota bacterium]
MPRLILASNRLPVAARVERGELVLAPTAGGLATGLLGLQARSSGIWIGWPGETWRLTPAQRRELADRLAERNTIGVDLSANEVARYYEEFSNGILWPLLHYDLERLPHDPGGWEAYERVNRRFAEAIVREYRPGDQIWVHDYQLMLVPGMVRQELPGAAIGFFLHVPFPSSELFRVLRWRGELLAGILGATLVGFHTASYAYHFRRAAANLLGCEIRGERVIFNGRPIAVGDFPMGIDAEAFDGLGQNRKVLGEVNRLQRAAGDARLVVSIDRLDYTKGIPRRLLAFERALERYPSLRETVRLIMVAAPSRENVGAYREYRRSVDELVGRINGRYTTLGTTPIHYISRTLPRERLAALYRAASVAMITPLRDGMNLVAKEYVATRADEDGVLVLSELAGAAAELSSALLVNPYDLDEVAENLRRALQMPAAERRERMRTLRGQVLAHDVHRWADDFVRALSAEHRRAVRLARRGLGFEDAVRPDEIVAAIGEARRLAIVLDYDGTLVPLVARPEDARPDEEVIRLLSTLGGLPDVAVHVVSGRRRSELEAWLGGLPIGLHAEHGLASRFIGRKRWRRRLDGPPAWVQPARPVMERYAREIPGSHLEEKEAALVWHYRTADSRIAEPAAERLRAELEDALDGSDARVTPGSRIVEVRQAGVDKGIVVGAVEAAHAGRRLVVVGDDTTDEDMFAAAPETAITVRVGPGRTVARYRLGGPDQVRALLGLLARRDDESWPASER